MFLGKDIQTHELVSLTPDARLRGLYVIGNSGAGKTTFQVHLALQDIAHGFGVCFLDTHGDAITDILARLPSHREKDVIVLDLLDSTHVFGLNLFQCKNPHDKEEVSRIISSVMGIFAKLFTETGDLVQSAPNMAETLQMTLPVLLAHQSPRMTMAEFPLLLMDEPVRMKLLAPLTHPYVRNFWNAFNRWKPDRQEELTSSTRRRVGNFLIDSLIVEIVGQSETTLPFRTIMDSTPGKIVLVKLSRQHELLTSLIGSVIVALIAQAAFSRVDTPEDQRVPFHLFADEYQRFCTPTFAELLTESRKFKLATTVAHQFRGQLDKENRGATLNAANLVAYQVSGADAEELAAQFDSTPPPPEIIGWRPILTPKQDVLDHLKKNGHVHADVGRFLNDYLIPVLRTVELQKRTYYQVRVSPRLGEPRRRIQISDLDEACQQLNRLFFSVMTDRDAHKPLPPFVCFQFARLFGFSKGLAWYFTRWSFWTSHELPSIFYPKKELLLLCAPEYQSNGEEIALTISPSCLSSAMAFVTSLRTTMQILADDPILIDTGQHEPIYEKPRQYADVQNEIATRLANLPKYTAKVKLVGAERKPVEHTIHTLSPDDLHLPALTQPALLMRLERIKVHNIQAGYIRERTIVEQEIARRHGLLHTPDKKQQTKQGDEE